MRAVRRVREVRERDSRTGLLRALSAVREREAAVTAMRTALEQALVREADTLDAFVVSRHLLGTMASALRDAEERVEAARTVAVEAHQRWQADKAGLKAIEHLLEMRALERATEAARAEVRETDDVVGRLHSVRSAASVATSGGRSA
jgi:flagellar biosynthesis chaperone FliJ